MKILCIGENALEHRVSVKEFPKEFTTNIFKSSECYAAGFIPTIAHVLGLSECEVYLASSLGNDDVGNNVKAELSKSKVNTDFTEVGFNFKSNLNFVIHNETTRGNTNYFVRSELQLKKYTFNITPDIILLDGTEYSASLSALDKYKDTDTYLIIDDVTKENYDLSKYPKNIIISAKAASKLINMTINFSDSTSITNFYNTLKKGFGGKNVIVFASIYGAIYEFNEEVKYIPGIQSIEKQDLSCEFEAFIGAYIYALVNGANVENGIIYGLISSGLTAAKVGAKSSIAKMSEVTEYYNSKVNGGKN